jgi:Uri superfamily endonuclease
VGSALGNGGLSARVARHRRSQKRKHWHIDYLLEHARIVDVYADASGRRLECVWSHHLHKFTGIHCGPVGFGASDCRCSTHLFYLGSRSKADVTSIAAGLGAVSCP